MEKGYHIPGSDGKAMPIFGVAIHNKNGKGLPQTLMALGLVAHLGRNPQ